MAPTEHINVLVMIVAVCQNATREELEKQRRAWPEGHQSSLGKEREANFGSIGPAMLTWRPRRQSPEKHRLGV